MRQRLRQKEFPDDIIDETVTAFRRVRLLDPLKSKQLQTGLQMTEGGSGTA